MPAGPAPTSAINKPAINKGQIKLLAIGVLPKNQKPKAADNSIRLNNQTILEEKTSLSAQSVDSLRISISILFVATSLKRCGDNSLSVESNFICCRVPCAFVTTGRRIHPASRKFATPPSVDHNIYH